VHFDCVAPQNERAAAEIDDSEIRHNPLFGGMA
jgi:hypothetical protein